MDTPFLRAQHYHDQAANLRKLASAEADEEHREALTGLANSYDRLAEKILLEAAKALKGT